MCSNDHTPSFFREALRFVADGNPNAEVEIVPGLPIRAKFILEAFTPEVIALACVEDDPWIAEVA